MDMIGSNGASAGGACPFAAAEGLSPSTRLHLAERRRMVLQHGTTEAGAAELVLYYDDKEVSFDEPELFAFAEALSRQNSFLAGDATSWGPGYSWEVVGPLLDDLLSAGILSDTPPATDVENGSRSRPSPLAPAKTDTAFDWSRDCATITQSLTGRAVDPAWLELIVPVFRVAHIALDADGRQVGEANVFPRPLRLDTPTEWMACPFPGTRYDADRPMNTTALKAMRTHWAQMMAALKVIRAQFLVRYPEAATGWTVAHVERLSTLVLAVATYPLVKPRAVAAPLHPALSSLFRVTDGLRMATHQMMFVPVGEPALPPHAPVDAQMIFDYAERNYSFHSETGVCAGPAHMVLEFIETLLHGAPTAAHSFDAEVASALADIDAAFDYGLRGLRAHAALFCFWPAMARAYEAIAEIAADANASGHFNFAALDTRFSAHLASIRRVTLLGTEERRQGREAAYAEIFDLCGQGLADSGPSMATRLSAAIGTEDDVSAVATVLRQQLGGSAYTQALAQAIGNFCAATQRILTVATACQSELSASLARPRPSTSFSAADIAVHAHLLGNVPQRLPFLFDEVAVAFGIDISIDASGLRLSSPEFSSSAANSGR